MAKGERNYSHINNYVMTLIYYIETWIKIIVFLLPEGFLWVKYESDRAKRVQNMLTCLSKLATFRNKIINFKLGFFFVINE